MTIKHGKSTARTFDKDTIDCNVSYYFLGGISKSAARRSEVALTYEPTLTIYIDANVDEEWRSKMRIPANIIVNREVADWPVKNAVTRPKRKLWHAKVMFDETHPAADFENGVLTKVTLWKKDDETGFYLGTIGHNGQFSAAFSENEIANLKSGKIWLTLTVGDHQTAVSKKDTKLQVENMSPDLSAAKPLIVSDSKASKISARSLASHLRPSPWRQSRRATERADTATRRSETPTQITGLKISCSSRIVQLANVR